MQICYRFCDSSPWLKLLSLGLKQLQAQEWPVGNIPSKDLLHSPSLALPLSLLRFLCLLYWELRNIYHHHPESKKRKSSEANSGSIHPYGRYGNAVKTRTTISTIAILWPVKAIFEKRAATVEVDTLVSLSPSPYSRQNGLSTLSQGCLSYPSFAHA